MKSMTAFALLGLVACGPPLSTSTGGLAGTLAFATGAVQGVQASTWRLVEGEDLGECDDGVLCDSSFGKPVEPHFDGPGAHADLSSLRIQPRIDSYGRIVVCDTCASVEVEATKVDAIARFNLPATVEHVHFTGNPASPLAVTVRSKGRFQSEGHDLEHDLHLTLYGDCGGGPNFMCGYAVPLEEVTHELELQPSDFPRYDCPEEVRTAFGKGLTLVSSPKGFTLGDGPTLPCTEINHGSKVESTVMCGGEAKVSADGCDWTVDLVGTSNDYNGFRPAVFINGVAAEGCARANGRYCVSNFGIRKPQ